ncbi:unnamed protein product [Calypogeia fissa]
MHWRAFVLLLLPLCFCVQLEWIAAGVGATRIGKIGGMSVGSESAEGLVRLLRSRGIGKIRLHNADSAVLRAISGASSKGEAPIEVIVGVPNDEIVDIGVSSASAQSWIARNVVPYFPATNIIAIAVGNEVLTTKEADQSTILPFLVPAMRNLYAALSDVGWEKKIKVSAPQSARVLSTYFPPSSATSDGAIYTTEDGTVGPLLEFLASSGSYFMLNLHPQDVQRESMVGLNDQQQSQDLSPAGGMGDSQSGGHHSSLFDGLTNRVSVAMASLGHHQPTVVGIDMEWSRTSASNGFRTDSTLRGFAGDIDPRFVQRLGSSPQVEKKKVVTRAETFTSRRFLVNPPGVEQKDEGGKRRQLVDKSWCVAKPDADTNALQSALDWACSSGGADCSTIQVGQSCFLPNTIVAHASYAFNSYYQKESWASGSCSFGGVAQITTSDPSSATCLYSSSTSANGTPSTPTGTIVPSVASSTRLTWDPCWVMLSSFILIFLVKRILPELMV